MISDVQRSPLQQIAQVVIVEGELTAHQRIQRRYAAPLNNN